MRTRLLFKLAVIILAGATSTTFAQVSDFAFLQVSDTHISPVLANQTPPATVRGGATIAWFCEAAGQPQAIPGEPTPVPAFALATGDLTEYGVIDKTWQVFEQAFATLSCPLYVQPGNHDNTWVAMYDIMRKRHGGENYSFAHGGCHFACISSASPQEPVPTIDGKTRAWLRQDLRKVERDMPIFVALHHPIYSNEFANPAECDTFIDLLRDYNVVLMLYGHGHGVSHRNIDGIDGVMGGSTFGKNSGYAVISVQNDRLRVTYRYHRSTDEDSAADEWAMLLDKPLTHNAPERLFAIEKAGVLDKTLAVVLSWTPKELAASPKEIEFQIDGESSTTPDEPTHDRFAIGPPLPELKPGRHLLTVRAKLPDGRNDLRTAEFDVPSAYVLARWRREFPAAIKAGPAVAGNKLFVACTDGEVLALDRNTGKTLWQFETGAEILGTPAWTGKALVVGSGDGNIYAIDADGNEQWRYAAGAPVYGPPCIHENVAYIGDNSGRLHALDVQTGAHRWVYERADYAIESQPCTWNGLVTFGAWDGLLYAVNAADGTLAWKVPGPKSSEGRATRYYAPADCGPVALGERLFVCDRGYELGAFDREGDEVERIASTVAAIAAASTGTAIYTRTTDDHVGKISAAGEELWRHNIPAGRFPVPPTCTGDTVYVCSNRGLLSAIAASDGNVLWQYQVTAGFFVMAPVAVASDETCYVAAMDGSLTAVTMMSP